MPGRATMRSASWPSLVDPARIERVDDLERRVAERSGERLANRRAAIELDDQVRDGRTGQPSAEDPEQERERHRGERHEEQGLEHLRGVSET